MTGMKLPWQPCQVQSCPGTSILHHATPDDRFELSCDEEPLFAKPKDHHWNPMSFCWKSLEHLDKRQIKETSTKTVPTRVSLHCSGSWNRIQSSVKSWLCHSRKKDPWLFSKSIWKKKKPGAFTRCCYHWHPLAGALGWYCGPFGWNLMVVAISCLIISIKGQRTFRAIYKLH